MGPIFLPETCGKCVIAQSGKGFRTGDVDVIHRATIE
jgi:hypothetical protein